MDSFALNSSLLDWEWSSCPETLALFIHILFRASDKERRWQGILIPKGGFVTTMAELAETSRLSCKQVRTHLKRIVSSGFASVKATNRYTIITISDIERYECKNCDEGKQRANKGQTKGKQNAVVTDCDADCYECENENEGKQRANKTENCDSPLYSLINNNHSYSEIENKKKEMGSKEPPKKEQQETEKSPISDAPPVSGKSPPFDLAFVREELLPDFLEFIDMRRKIRKPLKTPAGVKARYKRLMTLSEGDTELARKIIRQSIGYEWQDFYPLKTQDNGKNNIATHLRSEEDFSDRHYDTTLPDWDPPGGDSGADEELLP